MTEKDRLDDIADSYNHFGSCEARLLRYVFERISPFFRGDSVLELGCGKGIMSALLPDHFTDITIVDGAEDCLDNARNLIGLKAVYHLSLFEDFEADRKFDTILATYIFEHIYDPVGLLTRIRDWLAADGILLITVPNARSLHRQIGVHLGILPSIYDLSEADKIHGHRRNYDMGSLRKDIEAAGLSVINMRGLCLKPLSNAQMGDWPDDLIHALGKMSDSYSEISTPLLACITHKTL